MSSEIQAEVTHNRIYLRTPFKFKAACQAVAGARWDAESKRWFWPADGIAAQELLNTFGPRLTGAPGAEAIKSLAHSYTVQQPILNIDLNGDLPEIPGLKPVNGCKSRPSQRQAYYFALQRPGVLIPFKMGGGKTRVAVGLMHNLSIFTLIQCPHSVIPVWPSEFAKHVQNPDEWHVVPLKKGSVAQKTKDAQAALDYALGRRKKLALVINYESAWREPFVSWILESGVDTMVMDEGHKIKSAGGKSSKFCARLGLRCKRRIELTGTPMPHSPLDIYGQYRTLEPSIFGTNYHRFEQRYAIKGGFENRSVIGYRNQQELHDKIKSIAIFVDIDLELPPSQDIRIPIELSQAAVRMLRQLERDFYTEFDTGEITAANALVKLLRQQQITSGYAKFDDGTLKQVDTGKAEALEDIFDGIAEEPVVVFSRFTSDLDAVSALCEKMKIGYHELSGRANGLEEWQQGGGQVIGVNIQAGGAGIDLTRACYCIYYSLGFSLGDYMQSRARVHRPGQNRPVTYYHLVAEKTVDSKVYAALSERKEVVDYILNLKKEVVF